MKKIYSLLTLFVVSMTCSFAQVLPNPGFEAWTHSTFPLYDDPNNWNTLNPTTGLVGVITCSKATAAAEHHAGAAAVKLVTKSVSGQIANGIVTTGTINTSTQTIGGGLPYTLRPDSIIGFYRYTPVSGDNGFVELQLLGSGGDTDTIGYARFMTPTTTVGSFMRFAVAINYRSAAAVAKDRKSTRLNSSHSDRSRMPSSA